MNFKVDSHFPLSCCSSQPFWGVYSLSLCLVIAKVESVIHYGNAYDRHSVFAQVSGIPNTVKIWDDDKDSWNFAMLQGSNGELYPLHLLDLLFCNDAIYDAVSRLIARSLTIGKPVVVHTKKGGDLLDALSD